MARELSGTIAKPDVVYVAHDRRAVAAPGLHARYVPGPQSMFSAAWAFSAESANENTESEQPCRVEAGLHELRVLSGVGLLVDRDHV